MSQEVPPVPDLAALLKRPVPDNVYGTLAHTFVPAELGRVVPATENYVTHMPFVSKGTNYFLVLTDTKLYQGLCECRSLLSLWCSCFSSLFFFSAQCPTPLSRSARPGT